MLSFKVLIIIFQCNGNMQSSISASLSFFEIKLLPKVKELFLKIKILFAKVINKEICTSYYKIFTNG